MSLSVDNLQLIGQNLGRVFNSTSGCVHVMQLNCFVTKLPNLKLKTLPKQRLGYLLLDIALLALSCQDYQVFPGEKLHLKCNLSRTNVHKIVC
jgi:hypothetical protein